MCKEVSFTACTCETMAFPDRQDELGSIFYLTEFLVILTKKP